MVYAWGMENTSIDAPAPEKASTQATPPTAVSRKKKWIGIAIGACASFTLVGYGYTSYKTVLEDADSYINYQGSQSASELLSGYRDLGAVEVAGLRGFAAALGKEQAMSTAKRLDKYERRAYEFVTSYWAFMLIKDDVRQCIHKLHKEKIKRIKTLEKLAGPGFVQIQLWREAIDDIPSQSQTGCHEKFREKYGKRAKEEWSAPE